MTATAAGSAALTVAGAAGALTGAALTVVVGAGAPAACADATVAADVRARTVAAALGRFSVGTGWAAYFGARDAAAGGA